MAVAEPGRMYRPINTEFRAPRMEAQEK